MDETVEDLSEAEIRKVEFGAEFIRISLLLGITETDRLLAAAFLRGPEWMAELKMAEALGIPRSTLRGRIDDMVRMRLVTRAEGKGVKMLPGGHSFFVLAFREITDMSKGRRKRFSRAFTKILDDLSRTEGVRRPIIPHESLVHVYLLAKKTP
jgi:predicted transcriptional regulator